jgi:hypothetical protein
VISFLSAPICSQIMSITLFSMSFASISPATVLLLKKKELLTYFLTLQLTFILYLE